MECVIAKRTLKNKEITTINDVLLEIIPLHEAFPALVKLLQIALTVVVSTAECERSFSCLKRTKTFLRSILTEQQLVNLIDLALLSIAKELSQKLSLDEMVNKFAAGSKDIGRCTSHCLYMSPTVFMYPIKILYLVARRYYMVSTQGGVSFPLEWFILLFVITSRYYVRSNTAMLAQPPHLFDICQITHQQL